MGDRKPRQAHISQVNHRGVQVGLQDVVTGYTQGAQKRLSALAQVGPLEANATHAKRDQIAQEAVEELLVELGHQETKIGGKGK